MEASFGNGCFRKGAFLFFFLPFFKKGKKFQFVVWVWVARVDVPIRLGGVFFIEACVDVPIRPANVEKVPVDVLVQPPIVVCELAWYDKVDVPIQPAGVSSGMFVVVVIICTIFGSDLPINKSTLFFLLIYAETNTCNRYVAA